MRGKARLFPDPLPQYIRQDPLRAAECRVYDALAAQLDSRYTVFYSRPWLGLTPEGKEIDGEVDFVVAGPDTGMLAIEVKGGGISRDAKTEQWISRDKYGIDHRIKNPIGQARSGKYELLKKLKDSREWKARFVLARHGVIFPDSAAASTDLGPDMPLRIFAFYDDISRLGSWVEQRLTSPPTHDSEVEHPLGADGMRALESLLARSFALRVPLNSILSADDRRIGVLTDEQFHIIQSLSDWKRVAVAGGAGTGKTLLAVEKAKRLAEEGLKTLLLCYNRPLSQFLKKLLASPPAPDVYSFHEFCGAMAQTAAVQVPATNDHSLLYEKVLPEALVRALELNPDLRYDAIIIDEGQDFNSEWWPAIELCLRDEAAGVLYVFYDANQRVYAASSRFITALPQAPIVLGRNVRNAKPIFDLARQLYSGPRYVSAGPEGTTVEFQPIRGSDELREWLGKSIGRLCVTEQIAPRDVAVLSGCLSGKSKLADTKRIGRFDVGPADAILEDSVVIDTVRRFKGLERKVVVLVEPSDLLHSSELLYVAITRARLKLIVLATENDLKDFRAAIGF